MIVVVILDLFLFRGIFAFRSTMFMVFVTTLMRSISPVTIAELVVEEPLCNPVRIVVTGGPQIPIVVCASISALRNHRHGIVFGPLLDVTPIIWSLTLAVLLQVRLVGYQPVVDRIGIFL